MTHNRHERRQRWDEFRTNANSVAGKWFLVGTQALLLKPIIDPIIDNIFSPNETVRSFQENAMDVIHNTASPAGLLNFASMGLFYVSSVIAKRRGDNHKGFYESNALAIGGFALLALSMAASGNTHSIPGTVLNTLMTVWLTYNGYKKMKQADKEQALPKAEKKTPPANANKPTIVQRFADNVRSVTREYPHIIPGITKVGFNGAALWGAVIDKDPMYVGIFATWVVGNILVGISKQSHKNPKSRKPANDNSVMAVPARKTLAGDTPKTLSL